MGSTASFSAGQSGPDDLVVHGLAAQDAQESTLGNAAPVCHISLSATGHVPHSSAQWSGGGQDMCLKDSCRHDVESC